MTRRLALVVNPGARGKPAAALARAETLAREHGWEVKLGRTDLRGHAFILAQEAVQQDVNLVAAVGGDGTVREVAAGVASSGVPMAIVAAGGANGSYRELYGANPWEDTFEGILRDPGRRAVDLLELQPTGEYGLLGFSAGWSAQVLDRAALPGPPGPGRDARAAAIAAAAPVRFPATIRADGRLLADGDMGLVAIGGGRVWASGLTVFPSSLMDDGLLDVLVVRATDTAGFNEVLDAIITGRHVEHPLVSRARAREVQLIAPNGLTAEVDGEPWGRELYSLDIRCAAGQLLVAMPADSP